MRKEFRLERIELYNVFNYRGRNVIDFTTDREGNVFLFNIKNGGGKTSLFLGIKWGFYGFDSGMTYQKDGIPLTAADFMNQDERQEGRFMVRIAFLYDGVHMELRRECPDYHSQDTKLTLKVEGVAKPDKVAREMVSQMIPPDYGDFFMFNGEVLQEIANNQGDRFKVENVQRLMGVRQLDELKNVLMTIKRSMSEELGAIESAGNEAKGLLTEIKNLEDRLQRLTRKKEELDADFDDTKWRISDLEERRRSYKSLEGTIDQLTRYRKDRSDLVSQREVFISDISQRRSMAFLIFLQDDLARMKEDLDEKVSRIESDMRGIPRAKGEYLQIQSRIVAQHLLECPVCGSAITDDIKVALQSVIDSSSDGGERYEMLSNERANLISVQQVVIEAISHIPQRLVDSCDELYEVENRIHNIDIKIGRYEDMLQSPSDIDALDSISKQLGVEYKHRTDLEYEIQKTNNLIKNTNGALQNKYRRLKETGGTGERYTELGRYLDLTSKLIRKLDTIIDSVMRSKRKDILSRANEVFMSITNKPDVYRGLEYSDPNTFSMHIVRNDGVTILHPSSGEKHVMAISFLISLSMNSERLNPLMMDTPLSRLDPTHKANIGRTLASLDNQVLFLAQPGEMDDETLRMFLPSVVKMYESRPAEDNRACIVEVPFEVEE